MEYEIMICQPSHLTFNRKEKLKKLGNNVIGGMVVKTEDLNEKYPHPLKKEDDFWNLYYKSMLDSAIFISDKEIKLLLKKHNIKMEHTSKHMYIDTHTATSQKKLKKLIGIKLLVEEIEINDWREGYNESRNYDTVNDLFNPEYYDPDDWEFILKVKKIL